MKRRREVDTENLSEEDKKLKSSYEFWNACGEGNLIRVLEFCVNGIDVNFKEMNFHRSCLHHAVEGGHVDVVRVLIHNGADVNAVTKYGFTALHEAATGERPKHAVPTGNFLNINISMKQRYVARKCNDCCAYGSVHVCTVESPRNSYTVQSQTGIKNAGDLSRGSGS